MTATEAGKNGGRGKRGSNLLTLPTSSNDKNRLAARLKRDHPAIAARVAIGVAIEAELGDRRRFNADGGPRVDDSIPEIFPESSGKETRQIAAEKAARVKVLTVVLTPCARPTRQARSLLSVVIRLVQISMVEMILLRSIPRQGQTILATSPAPSAALPALTLTYWPPGRF